MDRARALAKGIANNEAQDPMVEMRARHVRIAQRRALAIVQALTAFYVALGSFAVATLTSLVCCNI